MRKLLTILFITISTFIFSQEFEKVNLQESKQLTNTANKLMAAPANDNCSSATALTIEVQFINIDNEKIIAYLRNNKINNILHE